MTCLLSAIGTKSLLEDEEKRSNPDENGGFEMGIWTFPTYLSFFEEIAGEECTFEEKILGLSSSIEIYTPEAHDKIINRLKEILKMLPEGKIGKELITNQELKLIKEWCGVGKPPVFPKMNPLLLNHRKWYERLLKIFESKEAVIYYE